MWQKNRRAIVFVLVFLLITGPGAADSWLSLIQKFRGNEVVVNVELTSWRDVYSTLFPVLGLAVLLFGIWWTRPKVEHNKTQSLFTHTTTDDGAIFQDGFEFFPSRTILSKRRPLLEQLRSCEVAWAWWNAGTEAYVADAMKLGVIKRLLLPDFNQDAFEHLAKTVDKRLDSIKDDIQSISQEAANRGVDIRYYPYLPQNTMLILNPTEDNTWIQVELLSSASAPERPSFRVARQPLQGLFNSLFKQYEDAWENSSAIPQAKQIEVAEEDIDQLSHRLYFIEYQWSFDAFKKPYLDKYIDLTISVVNAAAFSIQIGNAEGRFSIDKQGACNDEVQLVVGKRTRVPHGTATKLLIRQRLTKDMADYIKERHKGEIRISLHTIQVDIKPELPNKDIETRHLTIVGIDGAREYQVPVNFS